MPPLASDRRTLLESALKHERVVTAILIVLIPLASWAWICVMAQDMYGAMQGSSAWMMTADWDAAHLLLLWAMWAVMMTAMMLPSAAPLLLLYAGALRTGGDVAAGRKTYAMAAGYLVVWALFSVAVTAAWAHGTTLMTSSSYLGVEAVATLTLCGWIAFLRGLRRRELARLAKGPLSR